MEENEITPRIFVIKEMIPTLKSAVDQLQNVNRRIYLNKCLFIISRIVWKMITQPKDYLKDGVAIRGHANNVKVRAIPEIERGTLKWFFGGSVSDCLKMLTFLRQNGFIKLHRKAVRGFSATRYKLSAKFNNGSIIPKYLTFADGKFVKRLQKEHEKDTDATTVIEVYNKHISISEEGLQYFEMNYSEFPIIQVLTQSIRDNNFENKRKVIESGLQNVTIQRQDFILYMILMRDFYASRSPRNGRLNHNLTNLKREFRNYLLLGGKPLLEIDIPNSQPTLGIPLVKQTLRVMHKGEKDFQDVKRYEETCCQGRYYEAIAEEAKMDISSFGKRKRFKEKFSSELMFCRNNNWNTEIQKAFKSLYPNVYDAIRFIKREDHRQYAIRLQKIESDLMVDVVYKRLVTEGHIALPLHDAIYCSDELTQQYARDLIRKSFEEMHNLKIKFKDEL